MNPKTVSYFKVFGLFLLIVAAITFIVAFARDYIRRIDFNSTMSDTILSAILIIGYFYSWKMLVRGLKKIEQS